MANIFCGKRLNSFSRIKDSWNQWIIHFSIFWIFISICIDMATSLNICRTKCQCQDSMNDFSVHCANRNLTSMPIGIPSNVTNLDLSMNPIPFLSSVILGNLHFSHLKRLDLRMCGIRNLETHTLQNLFILEELHLDHNKLTTIGSGTFSNMEHLKVTMDFLKRT